MENIWLDVTTIYGWKRPVVGIVRTELECVKYALSRLNIKDKKIRFCIYIKGSGYKEIDRDEIQEIVFFLDNIKRDEKKSSDKKVSHLSLEERLKLVFFSCIKVMPSSFRGRLINYFRVKKPAIDYAISGLRNFKIFCSLWNKLKVKKQIFIESDIKDSSLFSDPFEVGDSYISMGLDWDSKDFSFLYKLKKEKNLNVVLFCYDIIPVKYPHLCVSDVAGKFAHYFSDVAWCADKILCISECTKRDIFNLLSEIGAPIPKLEVIKLGGDIGNANCSDFSLSNEVASLVNRKYILFVSTIERRKNHEVLYRAYTKLMDKGITDLPVLVFVGMSGWGVQDLLSDIQLDPRVKGKIEILNNVTDDELATLYKNAYFTVYPSLYEGWGLPIAESLAYGKYCVASNSASIPEVGGSLLEYLEPWSPVEWASRIEFYISNPDAILDHERNIKENYKIQKWANTACQVFESI